MKKIIYAMAGILALAACAKEQAPVEEGHENNVFTLTAGLPEVPASKVSVGTDGKVTWSENDAFAVWTTSGTKVKMTISDGIGTNMGTFTGTIDGELDTSVPAVYPYDWAAAAGKVEIPHYIERDDKVPAIMASSVSNDGSPVLFKHLAAVMEFTLKDVPAYACAFKLWSKDGAKLSGTYSVNASLNGLSCESGNTDQIIYFPYKTAYGSDAVVKIYAAIPAYDYTDLAVRTLDGDESVIEGTGIHVPAASANLSAGDYVAMPELNIRGMVGTARDKFIKVEGVKWAKGNLRVKKEESYEDGWQAGFNLFEHQWQTAYGERDEVIVTEPMTDTYKRIDNLYDTFNWGGLGRSTRFNNSGFMVPSTPMFDISGRIFSLKDGTKEEYDAAELTGDDRFAYWDVFAGYNGGAGNPTIYGDVAFWASKGVWRMPHSSELKKLRTDNTAATGQAGFYNTPGGDNIYGVLLTSTPSWANASMSTEVVEFTDADMESGVFLPKVGRRFASELHEKISYFNNQGYYWSSTFGSMNDSDESRKPQTDKAATTLGWRKSYSCDYGYTTLINNTDALGDTRAGLAIRPVLVD